MSDHKVILNEHKTLDLLLRDLRVVCSWDLSLLQQHKVRVKLAQDLRALKDLLKRHFATEESGSYLEEISIRKPSARTRLLELHREHSSFLQHATSLEEGCLEQDASASISTDFLNQLGGLLDRLKGHEQNETVLLQEVFSN